MIASHHSTDSVRKATKATKATSALSKVLQYVRHGWPSLVPEALKPFQSSSKLISWQSREIVYCGKSMWSCLNNFRKMCFMSYNYIKIIQECHKWNVLHEVTMVAQAGLTSGRYDKILHFLPEYKGHPPDAPLILSMDMVCKTLAENLCWFHCSFHGEDVLLCCGCIFQVARDNLIISIHQQIKLSVFYVIYFLYSLPLQLISDNGP